MDATLLKHFYFLPYPISPVTNPQTSLLSVKLQAENLALSLKKIYFYLGFYFFCPSFIKGPKKRGP
jgi:hypothetical protein